MAARLNHPSIVHIYDIVETDEGDWIVMELVEGRTLDRLLRDGLPSLRAAVQLGARDRRRPGRGARQRHRAPRPQGGERHGHGAPDTPRSSTSASPRRYRGGGEQDLSAARRGARHVPRDVAGAGARPGHRSPLGPVLARLDALRDGDRHLAVPRRDRRGDADPDLHLRAAGRPRRQSGRAARAGRPDAPAAQQDPGAAAAQQRRRGGRARADGTIRDARPGAARRHPDRGLDRPHARRTARRPAAAGRVRRAAGVAAALEQRAPPAHGAVLRGRRRRQSVARGVAGLRLRDALRADDAAARAGPEGGAAPRGDGGQRRRPPRARLFRLSALARRRRPARRRAPRSI